MFAKAEERFWKDRRAADKVKMKKKLLEMDYWLSQGSLMTVSDSSRQESSAEPQLLVGKGQLLNWSSERNTVRSCLTQPRCHGHSPYTAKGSEYGINGLVDEWPSRIPFNTSMSLSKIFLRVEYLRFITFFGSSNFSPNKHNTG